ncbi:tripartite motif-containing protein 16-like [Antennarius striatus]|uniref:tripartite motif-containing protein 16-like n=1 Tax=Antennarius striatus TaxID=241820 RepID=UPI0035AE9ED5
MSKETFQLCRVAPPNDESSFSLNHSSFQSVSSLLGLSQVQYEDGRIQHVGSVCRFRYEEERVQQILPLRGEMAQKEAQLHRDVPLCSICLNVLQDPITLSCGHIYCNTCIKAYWVKRKEKKTFSCPQCKRFKWPLKKNIKPEVLQKKILKPVPTGRWYAGPEDVACDVCTGTKLKATKSCLVCLVSYCEEHLQPHYEGASFKKHKLVEPSKTLQENICYQHDEVMKLFCRTDQQCICYLCFMDEHENHDTVSAAAERAARQKELEVSQQNIQQRIQDTNKDVKGLQQQVEAINRSADEAVEYSQKIFTELIALMVERQNDVKQQVKSQQQKEVTRVKELQQKKEQEIRELVKIDAEVEQLSLIEDHIQFLENCPYLSAFSEPTRSSSTSIHPLRYFADVAMVMSKLGNQVQDVLTEGWTNISQTLPAGLLSQPEPKTRAGFYRYSCEITLDPNTANSQLLLSNGNRKVTTMRKPLGYSSHPDKLNSCGQVLSKESLTGRCYWEVEWGNGEGGVAVAYKTITRDGAQQESLFGQNDQSWMLDCKSNKYQFCHEKNTTPITGPWSSRVGVYLDHTAGILAFYSISKTMNLLLTVQTTFTQPLYAGLSLSHATTAELYDLRRSRLTDVTV